MKPVLIHASSDIDQEKEWGATYLTSVENCYKELHYHDFYELLLITDGRIINEVNGHSILLEKGSLIYFRPNDIHQLKQYDKDNCQFINLTILSKSIEELWDYMGEVLVASRLCCNELPPVLMLSDSQLNEIANKFKELNTIPNVDKKLSRTTLRMIIVELYFKYLPLVWKEIDQRLPPWLSKLCDDFKLKGNFESGVEMLVQLSGKNHSYLCRTFKKYLKVTPTEYINLIKLDYAENLLLNTDFSIAAICFETGFENLSHFYTLFRQRYQLSPLKYRRKHWNSIHSWK